ncbi:unnamed protein product [Phytophthora fragariaefolia]|uniref:Unnamed protein product n=1 Tax=Phytophthora fragariaefolia TaxID=1490495 RepID=A0A9W6YI05_9STRA|nr:unnamed protein product [Phytophthora fragariaefolia]
MACRSRHCHHGSTYRRAVVEGCVRHVMSWRTSKELGVWTPTHGSYVLSPYEVFQGELRQVFEPPQNEFRSRAEFLDLQQGMLDVHAYVQRARYLVSNIVTNPIDEAKKVVTFMKGLRDGPVKTYLFREYPGAGLPAGDAVERVDIGHAVSKTAAPSESHSHCKKKDDKPNLFTLKVNSKRESSLRALVDCGASNNFVRLQSLARLDFEEVELPRSLLEYEEKKFVDELIVLDLDDKFDMVLGMPWLARHDPVIDLAKRTIVRFRSSGATESDGPVGAAHAPRGACGTPAEAARGAAASDLSARTLTTKRVVREKCGPNQTTQIRSDLRGSRSVKSGAIVSTVVDTQAEKEWPVIEGRDLGASAPGADAATSADG